VFETNIVVVGNVLTAPEWRRTGSNALVANFRVASTARRFDRDSGRWVDGNHLRVRVNCWRRLAVGVGASITVGDPIVVVGRLYTRDWTDNEGNLRTSYEMEAVAVGHDLARGKAKFFRSRQTGVSEADGPEVTSLVRGEPAELLTEQEVPAAYGEGIPDEEEPVFVEGPQVGLDPVASLIGLGAAPGFPIGAADTAAGDDLSPVEADTEDEVPDESADEDPEVETEVGTPRVETTRVETRGRRPSRRAPKREPVPA
jgi:single-strand DNA-binding protein